jgi:DNA-binding MarR family transcriptional regulator
MARTHSEPRHTPGGAAFTELLLEVFRVNGLLLAAGDQLTRGLGLSSARWQVLGAIEEGPATVAQIARKMGLRRQSVQRLVDALADVRLVVLAVNPSHQRSPLVRFSAAGLRVYAELQALQAGWANRIAEGASARAIAEAIATLRQLRQRLERERLPS